MTENGKVLLPLKNSRLTMLPVSPRGNRQMIDLQQVTEDNAGLSYFSKSKKVTDGSHSLSNSAMFKPRPTLVFAALMMLEETKKIVLMPFQKVTQGGR